MIAVGLSYGDVGLHGSRVFPQHLAIVADRLTPACDIDITTVSPMPVGLATLDVVLARLLAVIVITADTRLTQIVKSCPHDVTHHVRMVLHDRPVPESIPGEALRLPHHALRVALMVGGMLEYHIVIAHHVEHLGVRVIDLPVAVPGTKGLGDGARLIPCQDGSLELAGGGNHTDILSLDDLIADAPADDAGVVAVALHHLADVVGVARVDKRGIVVGRLGRAPAVEGLADDEHADGVAGIEEGACSRIMTRPDKVEASLLHQPDLTDFGSIESHRSEHAVVVMHTGTINQERLAVEQEATLCIEGEGADAVIHGLLVDGTSAFLDGHTGLIEGGGVGRPEPRGIHSEEGMTGCGLSGRKRHGTPFAIYRQRDIPLTV